MSYIITRIITDRKGNEEHYIERHADLERALVRVGYLASVDRPGNYPTGNVILRMSEELPVDVVLSEHPTNPAVVVASLPEDTAEAVEEEGDKDE